MTSCENEAHRPPSGPAPGGPASSGPAPGDPAPISPVPMSPEQARIEGALEEAIARGDFDDLPGAGQPLDLRDRHDPDWWIKRRLADDDIDRDALLPVVMLLRREAEQMDAVLAELPDEDAVREHVEDFNRRVAEDRLRNPLAVSLAPTLDVQARLQRWREKRAQQPRPVVRTEPEGGERTWWRRLLGRSRRPRS